MFSSTIIFNFKSDPIKMEDIVTVYNINSIQAMDILAREVILHTIQSKKALDFNQAKTDFTSEFHINAGRIKPSGQEIKFAFLTLAMVYSLDYLFE